MRGWEFLWTRHLDTGASLILDFIDSLNMLTREISKSVILRVRKPRCLYYIRHMRYQTKYVVSQGHCQLNARLH